VLQPLTTQTGEKVDSWQRQSGCDVFSPRRLASCSVPAQHGGRRCDHVVDDVITRGRDVTVRASRVRLRGGAEETGATAGH